MPSTKPMNDRVHDARRLNKEEIYDYRKDNKSNSVKQQTGETETQERAVAMEKRRKWTG